MHFLASIQKPGFHRNIPSLQLILCVFYSYADGVERTRPKRKNQGSERGAGKEPRVSSTTNVNITFQNYYSYYTTASRGPSSYALSLLLKTIVMATYRLGSHLVTDRQTFYQF